METVYLLATIIALSSLICTIESQNTDSIASFPFDCNRFVSDEPCQNNGTCLDNSDTCQCIEPYGGADCSYVIDAEVPVSECPDECNNNGICLVDIDNSTYCVCSDAYHGETCHDKRVHHTCTHDSMEIFLTPPGGENFEGSAYILGQEVDPDCVFDQDEDFTLSKNIKFSACGTAAESKNTEGDKLLSFSVLVQFDSMFVTEKDLEFSFVCTVLKPGSGLNDDLEAFKYDNTQKPFKKQEVVEQVNPVTMLLTTLDDTPVSGPQMLGTQLKLAFTLNGGDVYDSFSVISVSAHNEQTGQFKQNVELVTDGCVPRRARMVTAFQGDPKTKITLTFNVFKLRLSDILKFETRLKLCRGNDSCELKDCAADKQLNDAHAGLGRRRRDVSISETVSESDQPSDTSFVWTEMKIALPDKWNQTLSQNERRPWGLPAHGLSYCLDNTLFMLIIAGLVAIVIILAIVTITLIARRCGRCSHTSAEISKIS